MCTELPSFLGPDESSYDHAISIAKLFERFPQAKR
jgi:hypothetical protein